MSNINVISGRRRRDVLITAPEVMEGHIKLSMPEFYGKAAGKAFAVDQVMVFENAGNNGQTEFQLDTRLDPQSGLLRVECTGKVFDPEPGELYFLDELVLRQEGSRLVLRTIRQGDREYSQGERPRRIFEKTNNAVTDPPRR